MEPKKSFVLALKGDSKVAIQSKSQTKRSFMEILKGDTVAAIVKPLKMPFL